jgi:Zn-dependent protease with chaperone function
MPAESRVVFPKRWSTTVWVTAAALFVAICYAFTLALGLLCIAFALLTLKSVELAPASILLLSAAAVFGIVIVWSVFPRRDKFDPPGVRIDLADHPRLASEINRIAAAFDQRLPDDIFITPQVSAWVAQRGGILGLGSRRVMGLGLPLMQVLSVSQLRAVLAHECAHYYGGDTRLGPWLYTSRSGMARTLTNLTKTEGLNAVLRRLPYVGIVYSGLVILIHLQFKLFLRITFLMSRQQEYRCDELACRLTGSDPLMSGLQSIVGAAGLENLYWQNVVLPVIQTGYRPPLAEGFSSFLSDTKIEEARNVRIKLALKKSTSAIYDSHPPLPSRLSRMRAVNEPDTNPADQSSVSLFNNLSDLEVALARFLFRDTPVEKATPLAWNRLGTTAFAPVWRQSLTAHQWFFAGKTAGDLVELAKSLPELAKSIRNPPGRLLDQTQRLSLANRLLTNAFTLTLNDHGWEFYTRPASAYLTKGPQQIDPRGIVQGIVAGTTTSDAWRKLAGSYGIDQLPLLTSNLAAE